MKNIKTLLLTFTILLGSFVSCKEYLEEDVYSDLLSGTAFQTTEDATAAVTAVYRALRTTARDYYQTDYLFTSDVASDQGRNAIGTDRTIEMELGTWDDNEPFIESLWIRAYGLVSAANIAIEALKQVQMDENLKNQYMGEVKFLRALGYYDLTFHFGDVILNLGENKEGADLPLSPQSEVIAVIIADLDEAVNLLPEMSTYSIEDIGRASKGSALSLRAKTYLNARQWQKAADDALLVINSKNYELFTPYNELFNRDNINAKEFVFSMKSVALGDKNAVPKTYLSVNTLTRTVQSGGWGRITSTVELYKSYDLNDDRRKLMANGYQFRQKEWIPGESTHSYYAIPDTPEYTDPGPGIGQSIFDLMDVSVIKYERPRGLGEGGTSHDGGLNFPILRYAEVIFTRAEALNELSGGSAEVVNLVNQIRSRANIDDLPTGLDQSQLRDIILEERGKEFYLEGKRRIDLIRHDKLIELWKASLEARYPTDNFSYITKETHTYYPIPAVEKDTNSQIN